MSACEVCLSAVAGISSRHAQLPVRQLSLCMAEQLLMQLASVLLAVPLTNQDPASNLALNQCRHDGVSRHGLIW